MIDLTKCTVTALDSVYTVVSARGRILQMHQRIYHGLSFCTGGKIVYTHQGKEYISDREHAVFLPRGASYQLFGSEAGHFPLINFQCDNLPLDTFLVIPLHNPERYFQDYEQLKAKFLFPNSRLKAISIFYDILQQLVNETAVENPILMPAMRSLEGSFSDSTLSNATLAEACGISEAYFRRLFKAQTGLSPKQYLLDIRINHAKQLLCDNAQPIARIAEYCGFTNPYHFSRAFHSRTGLTPSDYRTQYTQQLL